ncbi:MAG: hypothetical protein RIT10_1961 [Bacteroidota bacterium]
MKTTFILSFCVIALTSLNAYSQTYEEIYQVANQEILDKIDQNKYAGIDILKGIYSHQNIGITGLNASQKDAFKAYLSKYNEIQTIKINDENNLMNIVSTPKFTKETLKVALDQFNVIITGYSVSYELFIEKN